MPKEFTSRSRAIGLIGNPPHGIRREKVTDENISSDELFDGGETETTTGVTLETKTDEPKPDDANGSQAKDANDDESTPPVDKQLNKADQGVYEAMKAEKTKRQTVEAELQALKTKVEADKDRPDMTDDPEGYFDAKLADQQRQFSNQFLNLSETNAKHRHKDFDAKKDYFLNELQEKSPELMQEALGQPDPYEFIYQTAKQRIEFSEMGDLDVYKDKIRAELVEEMKSGKHAEIEAAIKKRQELPGSLSNQRAAGGNSGVSPSIPAPNSFFDE